MLAVAVLAPDDPRGVSWDKLFLGRRVPIRDRPAQQTILPDGSREVCYFVNLYHLPEDVAENFHRIVSRSSPCIQAMVWEARIYPIVAEGVTVVRTKTSLPWQK